jgi:two-component system chemotaxis response regulator CheB
LADSQVRILIVDDSLLYRMTIREALVQIDGVEVVGSANDGRQALEKIEQFDPDLLTLDIQMPDLNGLEVLQEIKRLGHRAKSIMVSSLTAAGAKETTNSLLEGAFDFILKPSGSDMKANVLELRTALQDKIEAFRQTGNSRSRTSPPLPTAPTPSRQRSIGGRLGIVVIGTSTGGPEALRTVLPTLHADLAVPMIVVQHMPAQYTKALATRLDEMSALSVHEAEDGMVLKPGQVLIAPGGRHLQVEKHHHQVQVKTVDDDPEHGCRPSVDYLLRSVADVFGRNALAVIMTGMGKDGTLGCEKLKAAGGAVLAQDAESSVVYGMPRSVIEAGYADETASLDQLASKILRHCKPA